MSLWPNKAFNQSPHAVLAEHSVDQPDQGTARTAVRRVAAGLKAALKITETVSDVIPGPWGAVISGILAVWDACEVRMNRRSPS